MNVNYLVGGFELHFASGYDVIIAGGGAAGIGAAVSAAKAGAKTLLVEKYGFLGGAATASQVLAYCGLFCQGKQPIKAVGGTADIVLSALKKLGLDSRPYCSPTTLNWMILLDPETLKLALDRILKAHNVDLLLHTRLAAVSRTGDMIEALTLAGMEGRRHVPAKAFVDATGDANMAMLAGIEYRIGDNEGKLQAASAPIRIGGCKPNLTIDRKAIIDAFATYNKTGSYPSARIDGGIYTKIPNSHDMWWVMIDLPFNDLSSESFTKMEQLQREAAHDYVKVLRENVAGFENAYLLQTGPQIGIRESRHAMARYEMTAEDILTGRQRDDAIARAAWPIEDHSIAGKPTYQSVGGKGYAHVPFDSIRSKGLENLYYAGRVIGADPKAYASVRVMGTSFATGDAAGVAAAIGADISKIQKTLIENGAII